jgi:hypothetical protein
MSQANLLTEAAFVGATIVPVYSVVCQSVDAMFPASKEKNEMWAVKIAASGFLYHLLAEGYGFNNWFLSKSVAAAKVERARTERMSDARAERYNYSNYAVPQFPDKDVRTPMGDKWTQGSWTTAPGGMSANAVAGRD